MIVKNKVVAVVAVLAVSLGIAVVVWALASRSPEDPRPRAGDAVGSTPTASVSEPAGKASAAAPGGTKSTTRVKGADPRTSRSFCHTLELLRTYSTQSYGLTGARKVNGEQFRQRLAVDAETFALLADQAKDKAATAPGSASWTALAAATAQAENTFRAVGLDMRSQTMIVELAKVKEVSVRELPKALGNLEQVCGFTPDSLGINPHP